MASTWVLKLPQVDAPNRPILVNVTQKDPAKSLDLDLLATDGEVAFKGKLRQRNLAKLQSKNFEGTSKEWDALLQYAFVSKQSSGAAHEQTENLAVDCMVSGKDSKQTLAITLRNKIEDITHKLGAVELSYLEDTEGIDLFGWACQIADQRDKHEEQSIQNTKEAASTKDTISSLKAQLDELVKAKQEHEDQLLAKFATLLNAKKLKIRDYQRILSTAKVDEKKMKKVEAQVAGKEGNRGASKRKRKDDKAQDADAAQDDESDGFEAMDVDKDEASEEARDVGGQGSETPPRSASQDTETASEDDDDDESGPAKATRGAQSKPTKSKKADSPPPPPRSLPFQKKGQAAKRTEPALLSKMDEDAETESEDDEL